MLALLMILLGCNGAEEDPAEAPPSRSEAEAALEASAPRAEAPPPPSEDAELVQIEITWDGISPLYKQYFSDQEAVTELSRRLAPAVNAPAQLRIHYNTEEHIGLLRLVVPPGGWRQAPSVEGQAVDLQSLAPVTTALAVYRDAIASKYDMRVRSFRIGIDLYRGASYCAILPAGAFPPDGVQVSPCVELNGQEVCGWPEGDGVRFDDENWSKLKRCFQ